MKEIEVKYQLDDSNKLIKKLEQLGCKMGKSKNQKDTVYVADLKNVNSSPGSLFLRVRKDNEKIQLNAKRHKNMMQIREEVEFEVSSYEEANYFLELIGFSKWVEVNKKRINTLYKNCNICIDEVETLGEFVELEYVVDDSFSDEQLLKKIEDIAKELGIDTTKVVNQYYDEMIANRKKR